MTAQPSHLHLLLAFLEPLLGGTLVLVEPHQRPAGQGLRLVTGKLRVLATAGDRQTFFDRFSEPEPLVEFAHLDQATLRGDAAPLEIHPQRGVERDLKGLILLVTRWVLTSGAFSLLLQTYEY